MIQHKKNNNDTAFDNPLGLRKQLTTKQLITKQLGFTLLELMITLAVAAILLGIATPSFQTLLANNRLTKATNEYAAAFKLARNTAITKGLVTFVCPSTNADTGAPTCGGAAAWTNGFLVFSKPAGTVVAAAGNYVAANDELLLQSSFGDNTTNSITVSTNNSPGNFMGFLNSGFVWQANAGGVATPSIVICDADRQDDKGKAFLFSVAGRLTMQDTDGANAAIPGC